MERSQESIELGQVKTLRTQLARRLGELLDPVLEPINAASSDELERGLSRVIPVESLDNAFRQNVKSHSKLRFLLVPSHFGEGVAPYQIGSDRLLPQR